MTMNEYIKSLRMKIANAESPKEMAEVSQKLEFVYAVIKGTENQFRGRLVASLIKDKYDEDAQFAILFNEHLKPEEYATYQAYRVECKVRADEIIAKLRAEVEANCNI